MAKAPSPGGLQNLAEALRRIRDTTSDVEAVHALMDAQIIFALREEGFSDAMDVFEAQRKWYS